MNFNFFKILPRFFRHHLLRVFAPHPKSDTEIFFKIAETKEELEDSYRLLYECYKGNNLMPEDSSGLRCSLFSLLPNTTTLIAVKNNQVVGTVSLIKDSSLGFPSDKDYKKENDYHRAQGHQLVEVSALAVHPNYRKTSSGSDVSMGLMKMLYNYSLHYLKCTMLCATVHPKTYDFYNGLLGFQKNGGIVKYNFVNGALAMHTSADILNLKTWFERNYNLNKKGFGSYLYSPMDEKFILPTRNRSFVLDPVFTPETLKYFLTERTKLLESLTYRELQLLNKAYEPFFGENWFIKVNETDNKYKYRYSTDIDAVIIVDNTIFKGKIIDITESGAFIRCSAQIKEGQRVLLRFSVNQHKFFISSHIKWINSERKNRSGLGYGVAFANKQPQITDLIKESHLALDTTLSNPKNSSVKVS